MINIYKLNKTESKFMNKFEKDKIGDILLAMLFFSLFLFVCSGFVLVIKNQIILNHYSKYIQKENERLSYIDKQLNTSLDEYYQGISFDTGEEKIYQNFKKLSSINISNSSSVMIDIYEKSQLAHGISSDTKLKIKLYYQQHNMDSYNQNKIAFNKLLNCSWINFDCWLEKHRDNELFDTFKGQLIEQQNVTNLVLENKKDINLKMATDIKENRLTTLQDGRENIKKN